MRLACACCNALLESGDARTLRSGDDLCDACCARRRLFRRAPAANGGASNKERPPAGAPEPADPSPDAPATVALLPPPPSIDGEILSIRDIDVLSLREGPEATAGESSASRSPGEAKVSGPAPAAKAAPGSRDPAPAKDSVPPSLRSKKASAHLPFFEVDLMPYQPPGPPASAVTSADAASEEERGPDSGLFDVLSMAALEETAKKEGRADADLFNLSGGLFGNVPLNPPDLNALTGPADAGRSTSAGRPPTSTRVAPVFLPSISPTWARGKQTALSAAKRSARIGWAVALISAGTAVVLIALKLGASLGASEGSDTDPAATASATGSRVEAETTPRETTAAGIEPQAAPNPAPIRGADTKGSQAAANPGSPTGKPNASPSASPRTATPATPAAAGGPPGKGGPGAAPPPATAAPAVPQPSLPSAAEFNVAAAKAALVAAAVKASGCKQPDDPSGGAQVSVTFAPSGRVTSARVTGPPFQGTPTGGCIASSFRSATVPPFDGSSVTVTKQVNIR
jgi:hypothetical protein